jgi:hypothetical protein
MLWVIEQIRQFPSLFGFVINAVLLKRATEKNVLGGSLKNFSHRTDRNTIAFPVSFSFPS